ncbi:MAG TPA: glycosyltransferase, partial [Phototrophicaceae bacterium]|nr:glycosyltransferase [Phototrophicaceae bacterium]
MRIAVVALGSRGDVQPFIALGKGLNQDGHAVRVVTHPNFETLVRANGLGFYPVRGDVQEVLDSEEMRDLLAKGNFIAITAYTSKAAKRAALEWAEDGLAACQGMELIMAGIGGLFSGLALAEKLNIPLLQAHLTPFTATSAFPSVLLPQSLARLGGFFNRQSHQLTRQIIWQGSRSADNAARQQVLGLATTPFMGPYRSPRLNQLPILYGFSPSVIPKPADWGSNTHVTGYWFLDVESDWTPPAALIDFLAAGAPPV